MIIGIDASNLRRGGGRTHLIEFLSVADPEKHHFKKIVVWGSEETLNLLDDKEWLLKRFPFSSNSILAYRIYWQSFLLSKKLKEEACDILFVPGGTYLGTFTPFVTMSRNMLPFENRELMRYGFSWLTLKLIILRFVQKKTFKNANGIIFLTNYAKNVIQQVVGTVNSKITVIPHGINSRFKNHPKEEKSIFSYSNKSPFRVLYVSIIDEYKHQWKVVEAISDLRFKTGWPIILFLVGPSYKPALKKLEKSIEKFDKERKWVFYHGSLPYKQLDEYYKAADLGVFASSCENMPNILLEKMAAGLPVACSNRGPMKEILGNNGFYFDPENASDITRILFDLLQNESFRSSSSNLNVSIVEAFTWEICAKKTLDFIKNISENKIIN